MPVNYKNSGNVNARLSYRGPRYDVENIVVPWPLPDHPTADTYRVRTDSEGYTCDNEGTPRWPNS
jgi:hypothetical protein